MKKLISYSTALILGIIFSSFFNRINAQSSANKSATEQTVSKKYTCTMHPEVVMDKPGKCPKCDMALVEKTDTKQSGMHKMHDMKNMNNMHDTTKMKCDTTKMKKCCMNDKK